MQTVVYWTVDSLCKVISILANKMMGLLSFTIWQAEFIKVECQFGDKDQRALYFILSQRIHEFLYYIVYSRDYNPIFQWRSRFTTWLRKKLLYLLIWGSRIQCLATSAKYCAVQHLYYQSLNNTKIWLK